MNESLSQNIFARDYKPHMPPADQMIEFGLNMMKHSSIGLELVMFAQEKNLKIEVIRGPSERTYVNDDNTIVICLQSSAPAKPARFILLLTGVLREIMQNHEGILNPSLKDSEEVYLEKRRIKLGDSVGHMCAVAYEINQILEFTEYNLIDEMRSMGYTKDMDCFLENV